MYRNVIIVFIIQILVIVSVTTLGIFGTENLVRVDS